MDKKSGLSVFLTVLFISFVVIGGGVYAWKNFGSNWLSEPKANADVNSGANEQPVLTIQEKKNLVEKYIKDNISNLSPEKAVLGGTFYVTAVRFTGADTCVVEYEDGHIALVAKAQFEVSSNKQVNIKSFKVADFNKRGNVTKSGNVWTLVYEEPGKPALTAKLIFESLDKDLKVGDRVEVWGIKDGENVKVIDFKKVN